MPVRCKSQDLLLLARLAPIRNALDTNKYFDFNFVEIGTLAFHDALSCVPLALCHALLNPALLIEVPILQMLETGCDEEGIVRRKCEGVHRLP